MAVLVLTHSRDNDSPAMVVRALKARGADVVRVDTDRYPSGLRLTSGFVGARRLRSLTIGRRRLALDDVTAVWIRRRAVADALPETLGALRAAAKLEARHTFEGTLTSLGCFTVDPIEVVARASRKELQLEVARQQGLRVPATCITNDPVEARRFVQALDGDVVMKLQHPLSVRRGGREHVVYTRRLTRDDLRALPSLRWAPATFQERIERALDVRAIVVGRQVLAAAVEGGRRGLTEDWRSDGASLLERFRPWRLPVRVKALLLGVTGALGLQYGAVDLAVTPSGEHVFFEVNPVGEFAWLERSPGLPIAETLAAVLMEPRRRLPRGD